MKIIKLKEIGNKALAALKQAENWLWKHGKGNDSLSISIGYCSSLFRWRVAVLRAHLPKRRRALCKKPLSGSVRAISEGGGLYLIGQ